ncbi:MAG: ribbon-helix-helix protein, CopG family [Thermofilaceae archaeon]
MRMDVERVSIRLTAEQYRLLKLLVEEGIYPSMSDALREAIVKLLKDYGNIILR